MDNNKNKEKREQELRVKLDQIMKNLFSVSSQVLITMLNSLFQEDYDPENTEIILTNNEFVLEYDDYGIIRGDVFFRLQDLKGRPDQYHIDFQTIYDKNMVLRMFAYGFNKAKELTTLQEFSDREETIISIPKQLVIYIEEHQNIGDELKLRIVFPDGDEKQHIVPVMKYWQYKTSELLEKKLYPLLPLQVFKLRKKLNQFKQKKHSPKQLQELLQEAIKIAEEVGIRGRSLYDKNVITGEDLNKILTALGNLIRYLQGKYEYVDQMVEEVESMMKTLYDPVVEEEGRKKGRKEGEKDGIEKGKKEVALAALKEGLNLDMIHKITGLEKKTLLELKEKDPEQ